MFFIVTRVTKSSTPYSFPNKSLDDYLQFVVNIVSFEFFFNDLWTFSQIIFSNFDKKNRRTATR